MLTAVMACGHSSRGTGSMTEEFQAGVSTAVQQPQTNTSKSTDAGPIQPASVSKASSAQAPVCASSAPEIRRLRSGVSANTPPPRPPQPRKKCGPFDPPPQPPRRHGLHAPADKKTPAANPQPPEHGLAQGAPQRGRWRGHAGSAGEGQRSGRALQRAP